MNTKLQTLDIKLITILGPTATGKTRLAACLAKEIGGEVISADSRQVYRGMTIGTGKDLNDYIVDGYQVPYHLIDIVDAGYEYSVYEYVRDFNKAYEDIKSSNKNAILCGGTGMYLDAVLKGYELHDAPMSSEFRQWSINKTDEELIEILKEHKSLHNVTDVKDRKRLERAVELAINNEQLTINNENRAIKSVIFGVRFEREEIRRRITERLNARLKEGMMEEVKTLMEEGVSADKMKYYGLEYKYIAMFLEGEIDHEKMLVLLNTSIHQFAKRQMTWFRRMEKQGFEITWIDGRLEMEKKLEIIKEKIKKP